MNTFDKLWRKFAKSKKYREEFVVAQVKRGIPFQIRSLLKQTGLSQEELASRARLTQGVISRAANLEYGNLTLNTIIRVAAGFDVAFIGKFVPFTELGRWFIELSESERVKTFEEEDRELSAAPEREREFALIGTGAEGCSGRAEEVSVSAGCDVFEMPRREQDRAELLARQQENFLRPKPTQSAAANVGKTA